MSLAVLIPTPIRRSISAIAVTSALTWVEIRVRGAKEWVGVLPVAASAARDRGIGVRVLGRL